MYFKKHSLMDLFQSFIATLAIFAVLLMGTQAYAAATTLSVSVQTSISFAISTANFSNLTPGTPQYATTSLQVTTNNAAGWNVVLSGDNKDASNHNLQRSGDTSVQITDQTEWIPGAATSTGGNGVVIGSFDNSGDVLAFRVMTASSTNGAHFFASTWWGTDYSAGAGKWGGIPSSTVSRIIGSAGADSYSASTHVNDVQYYLDVAASQKTGTYTAPLTYTATAN